MDLNQCNLAIGVIKHLAHWLTRPKKATSLVDHTQAFLGWNGGKRAMSWHVTENLKKLKKENQDGKSWVTIKELQMVTQSIHQLMENTIDGRRGEYHSIKEGEHGVVNHSWLLSKGMVTTLLPCVSSLYLGFLS